MGVIGRDARREAETARLEGRPGGFGLWLCKGNEGCAAETGWRPELAVEPEFVLRVRCP